MRFYTALYGNSLLDVFIIQLWRWKNPRLASKANTDVKSSLQSGQVHVRNMTWDSLDTRTNNWSTEDAYIDVHFCSFHFLQDSAECEMNTEMLGPLETSGGSKYNCGRGNGRSCHHVICNYINILITVMVVPMSGRASGGSKYRCSFQFSTLLMKDQSWDYYRKFPTWSSGCMAHIKLSPGPI